MRSRSSSSRARFRGGAAGGAAGSSRSRFFDVFRTRGTSGPFASAEFIFRRSWTSGGRVRIAASTARVVLTRGKGRAIPLVLLASALRPLAQVSFSLLSALSPKDMLTVSLIDEQTGGVALTRAAATAREYASGCPRAAGYSARPRRRGTPSRSWDRRRKRWRWRSRRLSCAARSARKARATL